MGTYFGPGISSEISAFIAFALYSGISTTSLNSITFYKACYC
jgi:hypothetical protein